MNATVGDSEIEGVVDKFSVSGVNENGIKLSSARKGNCVKEIRFFRRKCINLRRWMEWIVVQFG